MPIGGATASEEGVKVSESGKFNVSSGFSRPRLGSSSRGKRGRRGINLGTHLFSAAFHMHRCPHGAALGQAEASDAIPKKRAKQRIKATVLHPNLYNPRKTVLILIKGTTSVY